MAHANQNLINEYLSKMSLKVHNGHKNEKLEKNI
jgi:hypothetical protein